MKHHLIKSACLCLFYVYLFSFGQSVRPKISMFLHEDSANYIMSHIKTQYKVGKYQSVLDSIQKSIRLYSFDIGEYSDSLYQEIERWREIVEECKINRQNGDEEFYNKEYESAYRSYRRLLDINPQDSVVQDKWQVCKCFVECYFPKQGRLTTFMNRGMYISALTVLDSILECELCISKEEIYDLVEKRSVLLVKRRAESLWLAQRYFKSRRLFRAIKRIGEQDSLVKKRSRTTTPSILARKHVNYIKKRELRVILLLQTLDIGANDYFYDRAGAKLGFFVKRTLGGMASFDIVNFPRSSDSRYNTNLRSEEYELSVFPDENISHNLYTSIGSTSSTTLPQDSVNPITVDFRSSHFSKEFPQNSLNFNLGIMKRIIPWRRSSLARPWRRGIWASTYIYGLIGWGNWGIRETVDFNDSGFTIQNNRLLGRRISTTSRSFVTRGGFRSPVFTMPNKFFLYSEEDQMYHLVDTDEVWLELPQDHYITENFGGLSLEVGMILNIEVFSINFGYGALIGIPNRNVISRNFNSSYRFGFGLNL